MSIFNYFNLLIFVATAKMKLNGIKAKIKKLFFNAKKSSTNRLNQNRRASSFQIQIDSQRA
jgi:hypothetical protein